MAAPKTSERFCAADADLTISSSDGVLFKVYRRNLEAHSPVFAGAGSSTQPENGQDIVELSESSETLELLFQFMYPQPQPNLQVLEFALIAGLAEAAEKYEVYSALTLCRMRMKDFTSIHPLEVLRYAAQHNHVELANQSAQYSMRCGVAAAMEILPINIFETWILFHERWHQQTSEILAVLAGRTIGPGLIQQSLRDPNPIYTYREDFPPSHVTRMMEMEFMSTSK